MSAQTTHHLLGGFMILIRTLVVMPGSLWPLVSWFLIDPVSLEFVKRGHCTALWPVQHPSMTPTGFLVWGVLGVCDEAAS